MLTETQVKAVLPLALDGVDLPFLGERMRGKVRDIYRLQDERCGDRLILITTDRLSAFDRILGVVPYKGQVLTQLSAWWFAQTQDIIANHLIALPDPNVTVAHVCEPLPVEVVVRGYITGVTSTALWYQYSLGARTIYGIDFPDGLHKNDPLPEPIITPTTKARNGGHDERITSAEVVEKGLVAADVWEQISTAALALFRRGQELAQRGGLILVDTKYEFGLAADGSVMLIDEIHTPDSSRFWIADTYEERIAAGQEPDNFDKEFIRLFYAARGYRGEGEPFPLPPELALQAALRYIRTYEWLTGTSFEPAAYPAAPRIEANLRRWLENPC
ncbi:MULTISPECIES: phosphoribosylaminoimidazolesuccinocarboxamide synthase [Caldilinea]|jgi:phosphoribosylaminoimidazole-succinocarboxamide synthase|uniref:Phosphoribosylaminoimidazole-succinocarboxamide synthase n=1 Tax=Caldilinea aerophila (strain DSM 14535 / JCM 11387 / NBRC 104270 / STL-6-O1) TaxID=926550 RepID=I0I9Q4_CALAS|nr:MULTISPECIES: phosphoribosylaminoimidazolesuccinocarboxamide synthase [Caldilinea]MBO9391490.1 phosphoribosylaminoimidazolesuccinocarboxamide synthase [Caldilinea sp.]BAM01992.1 phosphoribosylaminoimidazole-succinocarboxamide synthase [Caldilinea aerophila DSM 14535 = NBRC 104270]GIV75191.1 MAG: phosphoribosylaminoimidazole-succinocarboxamide synthase [Caldilinea sp.]